MPYTEPDNIKAFNYVVLKVLTQLYDKFPEPTEISGFRYVAETVVGKGAEAIETKYSYLFPYTMAWLQEEGFVKFEPGPGIEHYRNVVLTLRGLTVLGYVPKSLGFGRKKTLVERAKHALSTGVSEAVPDTVKTLMWEALKLMLRLQGNGSGPHS
jgi:hypothetical protein